MVKIALFVYFGHAYALLLSGWLLSQPLGFQAWWGQLPWFHWGTEWLEALVFRQTPEAAAVWLGLLMVQLVVGALWLLSWVVFAVMALIYDSAVKRVESEYQLAQQQSSAPQQEHIEEQPSSLLQTQSFGDPSDSEDADSIDDLVQDPEIQKLMHDLERRLRA
jgi:hypothetical protein